MRKVGYVCGHIAGIALVVAAPSVQTLLGFFVDTPRGTYEAAELRGAFGMQIFRKVALTLVVPGISVTTIFALFLCGANFREHVYSLALEKSAGPSINTDGPFSISN